MDNMTNKAINSIRILSMDGVEKAKSGHPGLPLGAAPMAYELWAHHLKHNPKDSCFVDRDRFVLSAGHGSMLIYSLLHLFGYNLSLDELKNFRQWDSKTPGHPEYMHTEGIETTTGPLGAGVATAVGMAVAEAHLAAVFNKEEYPIVNHYTYALVSDGCLMEGVSAEALSFAGTQKLDKLIVLYDSNKITIEGSTDLAFRENVVDRMKAYGFHTLVVNDGNNLEEISNAITSAKENKEQPSFIEIKTQIGFGTPLVGTSKAHSDPMGEENVRLTREALGWDNPNPFEVPQEVYDYYQELGIRGQKAQDDWNHLFEQYKKEYPELASKFEQFHSKELPVDFYNDEQFWKKEEKANATRNSSGTVLNYVAPKMENLMGGSADLAPSNKTEIKGEKSFDIDSREGRNMHFGVREHGMAAIANGMSIHGGLRSYCATFFVFTDFMKPMVRLASIMHTPTIFVMTHDSIGVGEDGPTHQPIEQLSMLRAQPNMIVFRPADSTETAAGWLTALQSKETPVTLVLSRQNLDQLEGSSKDAMKGAYVVSESKEEAQGILLASGSEVSVAIKTQELLAQENIHVRVVSMPSQELFAQQSDEYRESVLPAHLRKRVAIEAGAPQSWYKFVGLDGDVVGIETFGASAPAPRIFEEYGFTPENIANRYKNLK